MESQERAGPDPLRNTAWRLFLTAHARLSQRIDAELAAAGVVPLGWYDVLLALEEAPEQRLRLSELAEAVLLSRSGLTRLVDRLEAQGLLRREVCATDRRGSFAVLTAAGRAAREMAWPVYARAIQSEFGRHLEEDEVRVLTRALRRLLAASEEPPQDGE